MEHRRDWPGPHQRRDAPTDDAKAGPVGLLADALRPHPRGPDARPAASLETQRSELVALAHDQAASLQRDLASQQASLQRDLKELKDSLQARALARGWLVDSHAWATRTQLGEAADLHGRGIVAAVEREISARKTQVELSAAAIAGKGANRRLALKAEGDVARQRLETDRTAYKLRTAASGEVEGLTAMAASAALREHAAAARAAIQAETDAAMAKLDAVLARLTADGAAAVDRAAAATAKSLAAGLARLDAAERARPGARGAAAAKKAQARAGKTAKAIAAAGQAAASSLAAAADAAARQLWAEGAAARSAIDGLQQQGVERIDEEGQLRLSALATRAEAAEARLTDPRLVEGLADPGTISIAEYLQVVGTIEQSYQDRAARSGVAYDSNTAVSAMRGIYGYAGGFWGAMIPDAPEVAGAEEGQPSMKAVVDQLFVMEKDEKGQVVRGDARLIRLPDGDLVDPGHIYTGIDPHLHPRPSLGVRAYGIDSRDGSTWSGDVGSAVVKHAQAQGGLGKRQAFDSFSSIPDLNSDLDGYNLGASFDRERSLTAQLGAYYAPSAGAPEPAGYQRRFSSFARNRGLGVDRSALTWDATVTIRDEVDHFAEAYGRKDDGLPSKLWGVLLGNSYSPDDESSSAMTDRFISYLEAGMAREPGGEDD